MIALTHDGAAQTPKAFATKFASPLKAEWKPDAKFGAKLFGKIVLGEDMFVEPGTIVIASAKGRLVYPKTAEQQGDDVAILAHWLSDKVAVFTVYRPVKLKPGRKYGDILELGDELGTVIKQTVGESYLRFQVNLDPHDKYRGKEAFAEFEGEAAPHRLKDNIAPSVVLKAEKQLELLLKEEASKNRK